MSVSEEGFFGTMILTCPECGTQYVVKDGAIPPQGRQVRCAACKHSWHQDPEGEAEVEGEPEAEHAAPPESAPAAEASEADDIATQGDDPVQDVDRPETLAEASVIEPRSGVEAEERAYEAAMMAEASGSEPSDEPGSDAEGMPAPGEDRSGAGELAGDWQAPPGPEAQADDFSPFAERDDEVEPKRRGAFPKILLFIVIIAALAAAFWLFAPPEWKARAGLSVAATSPLALVTTHMDRQRLESGNELLTVSGRVVNPTGTAQSVPPLQALLRTKTGRVVYKWTIPPPARLLAPGASADFNSTEVDVPPGGDELTITLGGANV